jgi:DNA-binding MarR family transcriptional regulator
VEKLHIGQSSTSELINKLEDDGYIERKVDEADKRATLLFLTEKGQARAAEVADERAAMFEKFFSKLTDEEKQTLSDLFDKLLAD